MRKGDERIIGGFEGWGATESSLPPLHSTKGFSELCETLLLLARSFIPRDVSLNLITLGLKGGEKARKRL